MKTDSIFFCSILAVMLLISGVLFTEWMKPAPVKITSIELRVLPVEHALSRYAVDPYFHDAGTGKFHEVL